MEAAKTTGPLSAHPADRDKLPKNTEVVEVQLEAITTTIVPPGIVADPGGVGTAQVLAKDLAAIVAMAWDDHEQDRIDTAKRDFEASINRDLGQTRSMSPTEVEAIQVKALAHQRRLDGFELTDAEKAAASQPLTEAEKQLTRDREKLYERTGGSWQAEFFRVHSRGVQPLKFVRILQRGLELPEHAAARRTDSVLSQGLLQEMIGGIKKEHADEMAALKAQLAELKAALTEPKKKQ